MAKIKQTTDAAKGHSQQAKQKQDIAEFMNRIGDGARTIADIGDKMRATIDQCRPRITAFAEGMFQVTEQLRQGLERLDQDHAWLIRYGWPIDGSLPARWAGDIRRRFGDTPSVAQLAEVDELMVQIHPPKLLSEDILSRWNSYPFLAQRMPILREAIQAHSLELYNITVPAILTQIEGVVIDASGLQEHVTWKKFKREVQVALTMHGDSRRDEAFLQFVRDELLAEFFWGQDLPKQVNRHAVLHGADVAYGTVVNSLRVILVFGYLVEQIALPNNLTQTRIETADDHTPH